MHAVDTAGRPGDQDGNGENKRGAQVSELNRVETMQLGPEFAKGTADGGEQTVQAGTVGEA